MGEDQGNQPDVNDDEIKKAQQMFENCVKEMSNEMKETKQQTPTSGDDGFGNMSNMFKEFDRVSKNS